MEEVAEKASAEIQTGMEHISTIARVTHLLINFVSIRINSTTNVKCLRRSRGFPVRILGYPNFVFISSGLQFALILVKYVYVEWDIDAFPIYKNGTCIGNCIVMVHPRS